MSARTTARLVARLVRPRSGWWWVLPILVLTVVLTLVYVVLVRTEWSAADAREYRFGGANTAVYFNDLVPTTQASFDLAGPVDELSALAGSRACAEIAAITQTAARDADTYAYREFHEPCSPDAWGYELESGRWAVSPGEVVATSSTGLNVGDVREGLTPGPLTVVGTASTPHAINARTLLAAPDTWRSWDWPAASTLFPHLSATVVGYATTTDPARIAAAFAERAAIEPAAASVVVDDLTVTGRTVLERMPYLYLWVAAPISALAAGIALALRARFSTERRWLLVAQGAAPRRAVVVVRLAELVTVIPALVVGVLIGWALGAAIGPVVPHIVGHQPSATPFVGDPLLRIGIGTGAVWVLLVISSLCRRERAHPTTDAHPVRALHRSRAWRFVLAGFLACVGVAVGVSAPDVSFLFAAVLMMVAAFGLAAADVLVAIAVRGPWRRADARLAWRRIAGRPAGSALAVTAAALTVGPVIAMMVLLSSDISAQNARERLPPREDQALLSVFDDDTTTERLAALVAEQGGSDVVQVTVSAPTTADGQGVVATPNGRGAIDAVADVDALDEVLGTPVPDEARRVLEAGGILWNGRHAGLNAWTVGGGTQHRIAFAGEASHAFEERWANSTAGFILDATATDLGLVLTPRALAFSGVDKDEARSIGDALVQGGYDGSLVRTYRAEDPYSVTPFQLALLGAIGIVGVALFAIAVRGVADALRAQAASLLALGVPRTWLVRVFAREAGTLLALGIIAGGMLSLCITTIGIVELGIGVSVPVLPIAAYLLGILALFAALGALGFARVRN